MMLGETALYVAAENNLEEVFSYLLQFSTLQILKIRSKSDLHPFHVAAKRGHLGTALNFFTIFCFDFFSVFTF